MIKNTIFSLSLLTASVISSTSVYAITEPTGITPLGSNEFVFIENEINNEYFLATRTTDPRFTGASTWTKYSSAQNSLGYMGSGGSFVYNYYADFWLDNSGMQYPFVGIRCIVLAGGTCPASGYVSPMAVDEKGIYKILVPYGEANGQTGRGTFSPQAYEYLRNKAVGSSESFIMNICSTNQNYDPTKGERCKDASYGAWYKYSNNITKNGHLKLKSTHAFSEIWVSSDGTPYIPENSELCEVASNGIICKMVQYNFEGSFSNLPYQFMNMVVNSTNFGFVPEGTDIQFSFNGSTWNNWNIYKQLAVAPSFIAGTNYIYVLFNNTFFKKLIQYKGSARGTDVFTFAFLNTAVPQSGYYGFPSGLDLDIYPREYAVSIRPENNVAPKKTGFIGRNEPDIEFNYKVTQSAPKKADVLTVTVLGKSVQVGSDSYCLFTSPDNKFNVPIPAFLSYIDNTGKLVKKYNGCNENDLLDLTPAVWSDVPWDKLNTGYFSSTTLKLSFPMNDEKSKTTIDGTSWLGAVNAEGEVKVDAKWIGVNK